MYNFYRYEYHIGQKKNVSIILKNVFIFTQIIFKNINFGLRFYLTLGEKGPFFFFFTAHSLIF